MDLLLRFLLCLSFVLLSVAQTQTIVNPAGTSVVVVATTDPAGAPTTQTIQTLAAGGQVPPGQVPPANAPATPTNTATTTQTTTTQTTTTPAAPPAQGPVGEPAPTPNAAGGATPYTYTTVINGVTTAVVDNFSPTNPATTPFTPTATGTVWNFSQYTSIYGGAVATGGGRNAGYRNQASGSLALMTCMLMILML